jgi:hypothetical protein
MLMAYADGELDEVSARRVEQAVAEDPELALQLEAERALRTSLKSCFDPIAEEPIPAEWMAMIAAAAVEDERAGAERNVVSLDDARSGRTAWRRVTGWGVGAAIAASLVLGLMIGTQIAGQGPVAERNGALIASGKLARALDTQLASNQQGAQLRMLVSFRRAGGDYCRAFSGEALSGIACRNDDEWRLERVLPGGNQDTSQYRQAGSADAELMAAAQDMAAGQPLDAAQESAAKANGWR